MRRKYKRKRYYRRRKSKSPFSELMGLLSDFIKIAVKEFKDKNPTKAIAAIVMIIIIIIAIYIGKTVIKNAKADFREQLMQVSLSTTPNIHN